VTRVVAERPFDNPIAFYPMSEITLTDMNRALVQLTSPG